MRRMPLELLEKEKNPVPLPERTGAQTSEPMRRKSLDEETPTHGKMPNRCAHKGESHPCVGVIDEMTCKQHRRPSAAKLECLDRAVDSLDIGRKRLEHIARLIDAGNRKAELA